MKQKTSAVNQITEGVIWKQLLLFFFPIMLGTLFQQPLLSDASSEKKRLPVLVALPDS